MDFEANSEDEEPISAQNRSLSVGDLFQNTTGKQGRQVKKRWQNADLMSKQCAVRLLGILSKKSLPNQATAFKNSLFK